MLKNFKNKIKKKLSYSLLDKDNNNLFDKECPENNASIWSILTFGWVQKILMNGYFNGVLEMNDISDLPNYMKCKSSAPLLENINYNCKWPLIFHIYKEYVPRNKISIFIQIISTIFSVLSPFCLKLFITYIKKPNDEKQFYIGILYCLLLFFTTSSYTLSQQFFYWFGMKTSLVLRSSLMSRVFRKTLNLNNNSKREYNSGSIMNLLSVDVTLVSDFFTIAHIEIFVFPFHIIALLAMLCSIVGWCGLVGFGIMLFSLPLSTFIGTKITKNLMDSLKYSDDRVNLTSEFINGIRIIKLYAWEKFFLDRIEEKRKQQLGSLFKRAIFWILEKSISQATNALVLAATFTLFTLVSDEPISLEIIFTSINIFANLRIPLLSFPESIYRSLVIISAAKRIEAFLNTPETIQQQPQSLTSLEEEIMDIKIENSTFDWNEKPLQLNNEDDNNGPLINQQQQQQDDGNFVLKNIDFKAPGGKLTIVCGVVGSGKTSLLCGLIGEIHKVEGSIKVPKNLSFTTQQPFLINSSVRENILFGKSMDMDRYKKVIEACSLTTDLLQFNGLDLAEIGERGVTLSGGQKQRINLARALYSNSDCYIMDETLSAVDPEVASHLFDHCIQGMMKGKTRILVTHQLQFIPSADHIVVIDNGILNQGTYSELKERGIDFESIMKTKNLNLENKVNQVDNEINLTPNESITINKQVPTNIQNIDDIISDKDDPNLIEKAKLLVNEDRSQGEVGLDVYKSYFKYGSSIGFFVLTCIAYFISQLTYQTADLWLTIWSEDTEKVKADSFYISYYVLIIGIFVLLLMIRYFLMARLTVTASKNIHTSLLKSIGFAGCQFFDTNPSGRILNRFSKDISDVDLILLELFSDVLWCGSTVAVSIIFIIYILPWITIPMVVLVFIYYIIQKLYRASSRELKRMESITRSPIYSLLSEAYNGLVTIRSYRQQDRFISMMEHHIDINMRLFFYSFSVHRWVGIRLEFISAFVVFLASLLSLFNSNTGFSVLSITSAMGICLYLNWIIRQFCELEVKMNSVERIKSYIETPPEGKHFDDSVEKDDEYDNGDQYELDSKWPSKGIVEFKNVEIKYLPTSEPSLKNITLKILEKQHIGVVGRTGAGKSTIGISLFRLVECSKGSILIDGVDISKISLHKLRSSLGVVPQEPLIFSGSIRLNIDPFNQYSDEIIWNALNKVKLKESIQSMPLKLETEIQEGGEGLSFGEKQLVCLCRVILKGSKVILQDESTSGIDYVTASLLKTVCDNEFKDCTTLTIAHRLDTIIDSDKIAVIDKGELIEYDAPLTLIKNNDSKFCKLVKHQTNFYKEK